MIKSIDDENKELHILGDLNCNLLNTVSDQPTKTLKAILEIYQLSQLITEATRITNISCTLIDHYITSMPEKINSTGVIHTGISDHSLIYGIRKINPIVSTRNMTRNVEVRNMKRFNHNSFREDLLAQPWEQIVLESYTDSMWALWKKLFLEVLDKHAPVQRIRKRKSGVPWLTGEIKKLSLKEIQCFLNTSLCQNLVKFVHICYKYLFKFRRHIGFCCFDFPLPPAITKIINCTPGECN